MTIGSASEAAFGLVRRHGRTAASFHALDRGMHYWFFAGGCVAYVEVGEAWVAAGGPIGPARCEAVIARGFIEEARRRGKRARFFALEDPSGLGATVRLMRIGEQPVWNPQRWPAELSKKLRGQIRRAKANAVVVVREVDAEEISGSQTSVRRGLEQLVQTWLDSRRAAAMSFLVGLDLFHLSQERRFFVAEREGGVVAALIAVPIYGRNGWYLDSMLRSPCAPNGTMELLFDCAMSHLAETGSERVTFGLCPLSGCTSPVLSAARTYTGFLYSYEGLRHFKAKFGPSFWEPIYLGFPIGDRAWSALYDCLGAFLPDGRFRFLYRSVRRRLRRSFPMRSAF